MASTASKEEPADPQKVAAGIKPAEPENPKKTCKTFVKEMDLITATEFDSIPQWVSAALSLLILHCGAAVSQKHLWLILEVPFFAYLKVHSVKYDLIYDFSII